MVRKVRRAGAFFGRRSRAADRRTLGFRGGAIARWRHSKDERGTGEGDALSKDLRRESPRGRKSQESIASGPD
jgi:hypothetical protein